MDDPNITMEEEKARRRDKVFNWKTAKYGRIWYDEDVHDLRSVKTEFPAIVFNDNLTSNETLSCEPTISSLNNNEIDFRISFDESDDEDCTVTYDKNSFSYKIIFVNDLKTDSENDNDKVNMPSFPSPEPTVSCLNDLDFFKDFENEFPAIVYNDALTSKSDFLTEPTVKPHYIDEFNLKDETSLSECDEVEQNIKDSLYQKKLSEPLAKVKPTASRDKEVKMAAGDSDDALVCCVKNRVEDRIINFGASFHATYCTEELERFKLHSGKVCIVDDKTLHIAGVRDVVLKTSFGTSWTLKDVRWFGKAKESFFHNVSEDKETAETVAGVAVEAMKSTFIGSGSDEMRYSFQDMKSHQVIRSRDITFVDSIYGARSATDSSSLTKPIQKIQVVLVDIPDNLAENDNIVAEHWLSSEITKSLGGSSNTSEGSENSRSFEDSGRSDKEYSEDRASSKEGGSETLQVRRSTRESRAPVRYSPLANYLLLAKNGKPESYSKGLSSKESI
ncbi:hypothetical protein Tco_1509119 [Tanacetum coccineum]